MRLVLATNDIALTGASAAVVTAANELATRGHEVSLWVLRDGAPEDRLPEIVPEVTITRLGLGSLRSMHALRSLRESARRARPDAAVFVVNPVAAAAFSILTRRPCFYWIQASHRSRKARLSEVLAYAARVRLVVLNASVDATVLAPSAAIVPNPLPTPRTEIGTGRREGWRHGQLLTVGRLVPVKDLGFLLRVMAELERRVPGGFRLDIVGDGPSSHNLQAEAVRLHVSGCVRFCGKTNPEPWYEQQPFFLMSSVAEGQPIAIMEAADHGCGVIARDAPGVRDVLGSGYPGLTPHSEPSAMADMVLRWFDDPSTTRREIAQLRSKVRREFAPSVVADAWLALLERVDRRPRPSRRAKPRSSPIVND
jgi:glycosyltransferase involved in cell wall biosynthesis